MDKITQNKRFKYKRNYKFITQGRMDNSQKCITPFLLQLELMRKPTLYIAFQRRAIKLFEYA